MAPADFSTERRAPFAQSVGPPSASPLDVGRDHSAERRRSPRNASGAVTGPALRIPRCLHRIGAASGMSFDRFLAVRALERSFGGKEEGALDAVVGAGADDLAAVVDVERDAEGP